MTHKIGRIDQVVRDYFAENKSISEIPAKDMMPNFINKGIFNKNHRDGLSIRKILRQLRDDNKLHLLVHVKAITKDVNTNWYFERL